MSANHVFVWSKSADNHICRECGVAAPRASAESLAIANDAYDAAQALAAELGASISVNSGALRRALGIHATVGVSTAQGFVQLVVSAQAGAYLFVNGAPVESVPESFRKWHSVARRLDIAQLADWTRAQRLRDMPPLARCAQTLAA